MKLFPNSRSLTAVTVVGLGLTIAATAFATDTRHSATSGSLLITNNVELNAFPHLALQRSGLVELSSGVTSFGSSRASSSDGTARLVVRTGPNDDTAWYIRAHDGAFAARNMAYAWGATSYSPGVTPTLVSVFSQPGQMLDLDFAKAMANGGGFSVGLGVGIFKNMIQTEDESGYIENTSISVRGSWGSGDGQNVSAEIAMQKPKDADPPEGAPDPDSWLSGSVLYRGALSSGWVVHAAAYYFTVGGDTDATIGLMGSMGRNLMEGESGQVAVEAFIDFQNNVLLGLYNTLTIPGARVGVTQKLSNTFELLAGATATWTNAKWDKDAGLFGRTEDDTTINGFAYNYTLGLSSHFGRVTIDTQIHPESIPTMISLGNQRDVLAQASVNVALD